MGDIPYEDAFLGYPLEYHLNGYSGIYHQRRVSYKRVRTTYWSTDFNVPVIDKSFLSSTVIT